MGLHLGTRNEKANVYYMSLSYQKPTKDGVCDVVPCQFLLIDYHIKLLFTPSVYSL